MAFTQIDTTTPDRNELRSFGDDRIREFKQQVVDNLTEITNYPASAKPALKTAVWTTATRPSGTELVTGVIGYNTDLNCLEYYNGTAWVQINKADTVDGAHAGTGANNVLVLDGSGKVPQGNLPSIPSANLPIASASALGAIKVGANLSIDANGVLSALSTAFDAAHSFATNGYQQLSNGLIIQWGVYRNSSNGTYTVTLPIAFPHAILTIIGNTYNALPISEDNSSNTAGPDGTSLSTIKVTVDVGRPTAWIAIGY